METVTTIAVIKLGIKIFIFIGGVLGIIYVENLINKKPSFKKKGGGIHENDAHSEITVR
ncbi:hypothetical protein [Paenibacillus ferrarius]|uniref:hypothetical protein n=1 Tax=Paenibacillus ferrarius TaxID=1469647 RepID=UPI001301E94F|nr:hypothetical protein [Paenibacillus ferrarius]